MTTLYDKTDSVKSGKYTFGVHTNEHHWEGGTGLKTEDMPGNFLEQTVRLTACETPDPVEQLGVENQVVLYQRKFETTNEPNEYAELKHNQLVELVKKCPANYTRLLRSAIKRIL